MSEEEVVIPDDIIEEILVRLDLKHLVHCNRVCKSWRSLVSGSRFAVSHFAKHSITNKKWRICIIEDCLRKHLIGSSNGLVCIFTPNAQIIVANPLTGEVKKLENYINQKKKKKLENYPNDELRDFCNNQWFFLGGFGYDSSSDDYKVILGRRVDKIADLTCFHVLSLKSNVWKFVGDVKCSFVRMVPFKAKDGCGILCDRALHWFVLDQHKNPVILSFDLSTEEFKEIPQPDDASYEKHTAFTNYRLGIVEESLCVFHDHRPNHGGPKWVMKNYNGKQCWEVLPHHTHWDNDVALLLKLGIFYNSVKKSFFHERKQCILKTKEYISAPIYVQSLVSPQVNERPKRHVPPPC